MIDNRKLQQAITILAEVAKGVNIVVVPQAVSAGTPDNPALCLKKAQHVTWIKTQMGSPEARKYVAGEVDWDGLIATVAVDTLVIQEAVFDGTAAYQSAVIWHEHGHVLYGSSENGQVYLHEVTNLTQNAKTLGNDAVRKVLEGRLGVYRKAVDPGVAGLRDYLQSHWQITP